MKILEEPLLLNNLSDMLDFTQQNENDVTLVKRSQKEAIVAMSLKQYNHLQAKIYRLQQEVKKQNENKDI
jgi:PHD/YefM family antitoxin component YafN of YafNO toxin-antitoxin module